jgi:hypothetical protein
MPRTISALLAAIRIRIGTEPTTVFWSGVADQFAPLMQRLGVNMPITVVPNMKHGDMIAAPAALPVVVGAIAPRE